jgi:surface antigen
MLKAPKIMTAFAVSSALALSGCAEGNNEAGSTMIGAGLGGLLGAKFGRGDGQVAMAVLGTVAGAAIGNKMGKNMDKVDRMKMRDAEQRAYSAPMNETIIWKNPDSGHSGTVTPVREGRRQNGQYCREFQSEINVGGQREKGYGTACQQPDGSWKIVSS